MAQYVAYYTGNYLFVTEHPLSYFKLLHIFISWQILNPHQVVTI